MVENRVLLYTSHYPYHLLLIGVRYILPTSFCSPLGMPFSCQTYSELLVEFLHFTVIDLLNTKDNDMTKD